MISPLISHGSDLLYIFQESNVNSGAIGQGGSIQWYNNSTGVYRAKRAQLCMGKVGGNTHMEVFFRDALHFLPVSPVSWVGREGYVEESRNVTFLRREDKIANTTSGNEVVQ